MRYLHIFILFFVSSCISISANAQINLQESLAAEFYQTGEFGKAAIYYKKLFDENPENRYYYETWLNSLLEVKDYSEAEKELKKLVRKYGNDLVFKIDLAYIYELSGDNKSAVKIYDEMLKDLVPTTERILATAGAFKRREKMNYVLRTYQEGRKLTGNPYAFTAEVASIYKASKEYDKMLEEYMKMIDAGPYDLVYVKENLQESVMLDEPYEMFRKLLLKKVQASPENFIYPELLNWLFIQRKDFNSAFIQAKALDKRLNEGGRRLVELGQIAADNREYDMASKIYQSVIAQGRDAMYYIPALRGLLDVNYYKITQTAKYSQEDVKDLIQSYNDFINNYGMNRPEAGEVVLRLAEIEAQYNNNIEAAIALLQQFIKLQGINKQLIGRAKLALGDYLLLKGDSWESTLLYAQVEKSFKDDPLGHESKFRNARLSFYRADFEWAKAQLDVLKSSTSELIANNAMQLALLIQDNIGFDSSTDALRLFAEADFLIYKNMFPEAERKLDSLNLLYPAHSLGDEILMARANIAMKKRDFNTAFADYEKVYTQYATDILADDALFHAARLQEDYLGMPDKAKELYEKLILEYKGSVYSVEARERYRSLRGDVLN